MGCSPSHDGIIQTLAKNAAKPLKRSKAILPPEEETNGIATNKLPNHHNDGINPPDNVFSDASGGPSRSGSFSEGQRKYEAQGTADEGMVSLTYQKRRRSRKYSSTCSEQELPTDPANPRRGKKPKSRRSGKHSRQAKSDSRIVFPEAERKVDFPELLVKAHQDAYAFLNPNLAKFEGILAMAGQATQTQLIMQQMVSFMALRFDEINRCLGEIAEDGERLLKDVGGDLTWPRGKDNLSDSPDLLQQLLQYTVNRMQILNGAVSSLTASAMRETCGFLQAAADGFQEKLRIKEEQEERLLRMIKALEDSAAGATSPHPNDMTLYSEDSGFGGDGESIRGYRSPEKMESRASIGHVSVEHSEGLEGLTRRADMVSPSTDLKGGSDGPNEISKKQADKPRVSKQISTASNISGSSVGTYATLDSAHGQDPEDSSSGSSDESYEESDDNKSLSYQISLPQRPLTSPAGACAHKPKWMENPENEEMTLKMKEAISEKIKFVPGKSSSNVWTREETGPEGLRPSTADGSNRRTTRHRRSRSAESLKSQGEDPTLLELQRTQKELTKKLEQLYLSNGTRNKEAPQNRPGGKSFVHSGSIGPSAAPPNRLKACLDKSFTILPSQDIVSVRKLGIEVAKGQNAKQDAHTGSTKSPKKDAKDENANQDNHTGSTKSPKQDAKMADNPVSVEQRLEGILSPRQSVRKLIQAFSPEDNPLKGLNRKPLGPLRCVRRVGVPVLPPTIPACKGLQDLENIRENLNDGNPPTLMTGTRVSPLEASDDHYTYTNESGMEDPEDLPPPPLEILMDDSFNLLRHDGANHSTQPCPTKSSSTTSKIRTSINIRDLLPNKNSTEAYVTAAKASARKESGVGPRKFSLQYGQHSRGRDPRAEPLHKNEIEEVAHLYRQSHKIIPLQNPGDGEALKSVPSIDCAEQSTSESLSNQKLRSPALQRSEKSPLALRRNSPTRATASSPPTERKTASPPTVRAVIKSRSQVQPSPPPGQKSTSPSGSFTLPSPPNHSVLSSPQTLRKLPSPPQIRRQQIPPSQPSPPQIRRQQSPPSHQRQPSPPQIQRQQSPPSQPSPPQIRRQQSPPSQCRVQSPPQIRRQQSPPSQQRQPSPPQMRRQQSQPNHQRQPSPPQIHRQQSPPSQPSPPQIRGQQSPPNHQRQPSPPQIRGQGSPPSHRRASSPPSSRREPSPPSHFPPSPPLSPSFTHKTLRRSSDEPQASPKMFGNAQSIFCPSSTSLFEAKPASPPCTNISEVSPNQASVSVLKHSLSGRQYDDRHRRLATSAANPQPFVRRCYSDRRPRVQLRLPTSLSTALSEPSLQQAG
ncbi:photoreceptor cilium actin regulator-like [Mantella aurantiaca]